MWAAARRGAEVPTSHWHLAHGFGWLSNEFDDLGESSRARRAARLRVQVWEMVSEEAPDDAEARVGLSSAHVGLSLLQTRFGAKRSLERAMEIALELERRGDSADWTCHRIPWLQLQLGQAEAARDRYELALTSNDVLWYADEDAYYDKINLGNAYLLMGDVDAAWGHYQELLEHRDWRDVIRGDLELFRRLGYGNEAFEEIERRLDGYEM